MDNILNKIIELDNTAKKRIMDIREKEENIETYISEEIEQEKAKIDSKYLFKRKKMQEKYDEMFEQKKQELDSEKEKQISLIKEKYEQEKGKILETVLNNIII